MSLKSVLAGAALALSVGAADAATVSISFESLNFGALAGDTLTISSGGVDVTFSGVGLNIRSIGDEFDSTYGITRYLSSKFDGAEIAVTITGFLATAATILNPINGSVTSEIDVIRGIAFNAASVIVDGPTDSSAALLTLAGSGITSLLFDDLDDGRGYVIGNLTLEGSTVASIPLPATLPLLLAGLGGVATLRRRRQSLACASAS